MELAKRVKEMVMIKGAASLPGDTKPEGGKAERQKVRETEGGGDQHVYMYAAVRVFAAQGKSRSQVTL